MSKSQRPLAFFATHPVFRRDEFVRAHAAGGRSHHTSANLLAKHVAAGRLVRVRGGLFSVVPAGTEAASATVDPYLVASHLTDDAVVAYHAALQFHGKAYSMWRRYHYVTRKRARPMTFRGLEFVPVQASAALRRIPEQQRGVSTVRHAGSEVRVTTLERTMVDVLDSPDKAGGWEEVWRSLEMVEFFDLDALVTYALALRSAVTAARVGFFLDQHRKPLMVEEHHLKALRKRAPKAPRYFSGKRESGKVVAGWNLVVPTYVLEHGWAE